MARSGSHGGARLVMVCTGKAGSAGHGRERNRTALLGRSWGVKPRQARMRMAWIVHDEQGKAGVTGPGQQSKVSRGQQWQESLGEPWTDEGGESCSAMAGMARSCKDGGARNGRPGQERLVGASLVQARLGRPVITERSVMRKWILTFGLITSLLLPGAKVKADELPPLLLPTYLPFVVSPLPTFPPCECIPNKPCVC